MRCRWCSADSSSQAFLQPRWARPRAALNALATSFTKDFYLPYINPQCNRPAGYSCRRGSPHPCSGILMILVATMAANARLAGRETDDYTDCDRNSRLHLRSLLAVFLLGMLTRSRGRDGANVIAMIIGITSSLILCKVALPAFDCRCTFTGRVQARGLEVRWFMPDWWPKIAWPWFVLSGAS